MNTKKKETGTQRAVETTVIQESAVGAPSPHSSFWEHELALLEHQRFSDFEKAADWFVDQVSKKLRCNEREKQHMRDLVSLDPTIEQIIRATVR